MTLNLNELKELSKKAAFEVDIKEKGFTPEENVDYKVIIDLQSMSESTKTYTRDDKVTEYKRFSFEISVEGVNKVLTLTEGAKDTLLSEWFKAGDTDNALFNCILKKAKDENGYFKFTFTSNIDLS